MDQASFDTIILNKYSVLSVLLIINVAEFKAPSVIGNCLPIINAEVSILHVEFKVLSMYTQRLSKKNTKLFNNG